MLKFGILPYTSVPHVEGEMDFMGEDRDEHPFIILIHYPFIILISNFYSAYYLMTGWSVTNHFGV